MEDESKVRDQPEVPSISRRTLEDMDEAVRRLDRGEVGEMFDLEEVQDLLDKA